eukprot:NODE_22887_length_690_cov_2.653641.p1 GENE.NODE_22887_length_690_cov_2.653641~~NODE_22887_length_690_cov_2.653641.p1  ORF type:complete len:143 (+),score=36.39 NODE_22887_length_690_cov_2.653641:218-646(+)
MPRIPRVGFVDFWRGFLDERDPWCTRSTFLELLAPCEAVDATEGPCDVLLFSVWRDRHVRLLQGAPASEVFSSELAKSPSARLVFYTAENCRPPLGAVPLCLSFDRVPRRLMPYGSAHFRLPFWALMREVGFLSQYRFIVCS